MIEGPIYKAMVAGELPVLVSLGRHDMELARAAVDAGAFGIKFHLNAYHRATGTTFGSFAEEQPFIEQLAGLGKPLLVMSGQEVQPSAAELEMLTDYGVEGWNVYVKHVQPHLLQSRLRPILALDSDSGESELAAIRSMPGAMVEASITRFEDYGKPLDEADIERYGEIARNSGLLTIAPSQKRFTPDDMPRLRAVGISAVLVGAVVTGLEPADLRKRLAPIVAAAETAG
ncbi:MAG TPA: hypothetical protein VGN80_09885 [Devosiaceae bacterium]|jgi:hypothetical protein|nr:hypothetical protein [Devosiaceae bacterium]